MNDGLCDRLAQQHMRDRLRAAEGCGTGDRGAWVDRAAGWERSGRASVLGRVDPGVRAVPGPTAYPAPEAWANGGSARRRLRMAETAVVVRGSQQRSMVVLPSRSVDRWHEPPAETRSYEERLLSFLFDLRDPDLELTYVTSLPVAPRTIDYYISLLPRKVRRSARNRLRLVSLDDGGQRPLSEKLLERPGVLQRIRGTFADPKAAYLMPYNSTAVERDIAFALGIPLYGADPDQAWLGTKSGGRALFAEARRRGCPIHWAQRTSGASRMRSARSASSAR